MDTFMDKLAQKLTAQEMIKANTAAETEEMNKLKDRNREYREILSRLQNLLSDSEEKLKNAKVDGDAINRLVEESIAKIEQLQRNPEALGEMKTLLAEQKSFLENQLNGRQEYQSSLEEQKKALDELKGSLEEWNQTLGEKLLGLDENVHKECVKVYRNVQAVVVEENGKQTESVVKAVNELKGKLGTVFGVSVAALAFALGGVVFQVLVWLQIL